ncbi:MAG: T9SS type A sorting domain-containing protein [Bacteroidota bacterium]
MRKIIRLIPIAILFLAPGNMLYGQCEPDAGCVDINEPGEICPGQLPAALVNEPYDEVITVIPPGEVSFGENTILIKYITIDTIENLPEGLSYAANSDKLWADSAYCVGITGTPVKTGVFPLAIYVTPFVEMAGNIMPGDQVKNDTSVVMTVLQWPAGLDPGQAMKFRVLPNIPNPFSEVTRIGFFTPFDDLIQLQVYNILGTLMYKEWQGASPGKNLFEFDGSSLQPGTYIYRISNSKEVHTGKLIKVRR